LTGDEIRARVSIAASILVIASAGAIMFARTEKQKPPIPTEPVEEESNAPDLQTGTPVPQMDPSYSFTLVAVGDIMLGRGVGRKIKSLNAEFPFGGVADLLREADLTFGNLESPISSLGMAAKGKEVVFRAGLESINGIKNAGIDVLSLANNHAMDYGPAALAETMDVLAHSGVAYTGAGANSAAARRPANFTVKGVKVSFLAYSNRFHKVVEAQEERPGVAIASAEEVKADVEKAKQWADVVIVSFHWGWEYSDHPDAETRELAHLAVESGASLVIGHHPHVIQGVEMYKGGLICYSLGNFIFDQRGTRTRRGLILRCTIGRRGVRQGELLPVIIDAAEFRPALVSGEVAKPVLLELKRLSKQLGTDLDTGRLTLDMGEHKVRPYEHQASSIQHPVSSIK
jgi:poly-gamma-glutamate capsule biosynthesis protein CapA/YwtB (metallophosphatase superfamily)